MRSTPSRLNRPGGCSARAHAFCSCRAARRAQWQAKGVRQGLTDTVSSIKSVASMHSMMASSRPPPSPTRVRPIPNHEASGYNLAPAFVPSSSSVAPASTGLSVRPLLTQSLRAAPLRDHARGHGGGPVGAASKLAMAQWVSGGGGGGGDGGGDRPEALLGAIQGGFAHREVGRIGLGVGELQARRDAGALGSFDPWHARDAPAAAEAFLGRRSMEGPLPSTDPPNSKFRPHHPSALPAFQESLRPSGLVRPPRGAIQAQREAGHGAGAGYVGYGHSMNVGSTIRYAEPGTAGFAEASETFRGEKPFGRVPADPTTLVSCWQAGALAQGDALWDLGDPLQRASVREMFRTIGACLLAAPGEGQGGGGHPSCCYFRAEGSHAGQVHCGVVRLLRKPAHPPCADVLASAELQRHAVTLWHMG